MSNATLTSRLAFQTSTTDGATRLMVLPNGTSTTSAFNLLNSSDANNASYLTLACESTVAAFRATNAGTGTLLPMAWVTGGSERMRLDTSGNLLVNTASSGFNAAGLPLVVGSGSGNTGMTIYSGTAGVGSIHFGDTVTTGADGYRGFLNYNHSTNAMQLGTDATARITIDAIGSVGIGGAADPTDKFAIRGTLPSSSTASLAFINRATVPSTTTTIYQGFTSLLYTQAASFTLGNAVHFQAQQVSIGAGSTVTNQFGFLVDSGMTGATNNYGFYSNIASGSNRWNFYAAGTAQNYFAGATTFGTTSTNPVGGNVAGTVIGANGTLGITRDSEAALLVNRKTNDGDLVQFFQDGTLEGSISVAGNTISYNPFMGSHYTEIVGAMPTLKGTVLESLDELVDGNYSNQDRLPKAKISDTAGSSSVYGVYFSPDSDPETNDGILAAALGASWVRIAAGVTVQRGDLLESNGDGCAKVQSDDIIRSKTIGKVTSTTVADTYADGSYIVPCVLYCG